VTTNRAAQIQPLTERPAWKALTAHHQKVRDLHLRELFANDIRRGERLTAEAAGLYLDYSKNRVTDETIRLLLRLADECSLAERIACPRCTRSSSAWRPFAKRSAVAAGTATPVGPFATSLTWVSAAPISVR
jgi:hypothetical protein